MAARTGTIRWITWSLSLLLFFNCSQSRETTKVPGAGQLKFPKWTWSVLEEQSFKEKYSFDQRINPFYLQADFDKDGFFDMAILVKDRKSGNAGLALLRQGEKKAKIFGAGQATGFGGENWDWLQTWKTESVLPGGAGVNQAGEVLILFPRDRNKNAPWLFWNGQKWQWKKD